MRLMLALLLLLSCAARAGEPELLEPEKAFRFSARMMAPDRLEVRYEIAPGYYMYREKFRFGAEPASVSLDASQFAPGAGLAPVPELARLMVEGEPGRIRVLATAVLRSATGEDFGQLTPATPLEVREAIAARYRDLYESARAAQGR